MSRTKGSPNKRSMIFLKNLEARDFKLVDEFLALYSRVDDNKKMDALLRVFAYCFPTLKAIEISAEEGSLLTITPENRAALIDVATLKIAHE